MSGARGGGGPQRFDLRRLSTGVAIGDDVTAEQRAEAYAYLRAYTGERKFVLSLQDWLRTRGSLSPRQVAAVLNVMRQEDQW